MNFLSREAFLNRPMYCTEDHMIIAIIHSFNDVLTVFSFRRWTSDIHTNRKKDTHADTRNQSFLRSHKLSHKQNSNQNQTHDSLFTLWFMKCTKRSTDVISSIKSQNFNHFLCHFRSNHFYVVYRFYENQFLPLLSELILKNKSQKNKNNIRSKQR